MAESEQQVAGKADLTVGASRSAPAPSPTPDGVISLAAWEKVVGEWVNAHIRNSPVALSTDAWNHLMGALTHLRTHVNSHLKG